MLDLLSRFRRPITAPDAIRERIAQTPVALRPFPYLYVPMLFSDAECAEVVADWPASSSMADEGGGLDRDYFELVRDDVVCVSALPEPQRSFWDAMLRGQLASLLQGVASAFAPWIAAKFERQLPREIALQIHRLMCLEAGEKFVEHEPHSHIGASNWVFTFLLYIDDSGREDRGTTLYSADDLDFDAQLPDVLAGRLKKFSPAFRAPFRRGALIAFYDCALSVHGSTPFQQSGENRSRRLIRAHVSLGPREVEAIYGMPTARLNSEGLEAELAYLKTGAKAAVRGLRFAKDIAVMRSIANGAQPRLRWPPRFTLPFLDACGR
jgi:hypothetical protein